MGAEHRKCAACGNGFIGGPRKKYCSDACKQSAHRERVGANRNNRNAEGVTAMAPAGSSAVHTAEAMQVLAGLDAELSENAKVLGRPLAWSTADDTNRDLIADAIDRRADMKRRYQESTDDKAALKLAAEIRLLDRLVSELLKQVRTEMPAPVSNKSRKAAHAANVRWSRDA